MHILNYTTVCWADKTNKLLYSLLILPFLFSSCQKKENTIGSDFVGNRNPFTVSYEDSTTLVAYTCNHDSFSTNVLRYFMLGQLNDPAIGTTKCDLITQFSLPKEQFDFGTDSSNVVIVPEIDSIVLQLPYIPYDAARPNNSYYGDLTATQRINVYELSESLTADSSYYSNRNYSTSPTLIGQVNHSFEAFRDSVLMPYANDTIRLGPHLRIRLDNITSMFKDRFTMPDANSAGIFKSSLTLQQAFKGLVVKPSSSTGNGCIALLNLNSAAAAVVIYYNHKYRAEFPIYQNSIRANKFNHNFNPAIALQPALGGVHSDVNYVQPGSGLKTHISIPHLFDYVKNQKIAITGAEMLFTVKSGTADALYTLPLNLRLYSSDSLGRFSEPYDYAVGGTYLGGWLEEGAKTYRFNIIRELQHIINEYQNNNRNLNYGFNLFVWPYNPVTAQRVILDTKPGQNFKLKLTYTVIK